jgi:hypothetical protein
VSMGGTYCSAFYLILNRFFKQGTKSFCIKNVEKDTIFEGLSSPLKIADRLPRSKIHTLW